MKILILIVCFAISLVSLRSEDNSIQTNAYIETYYSKTLSGNIDGGVPLRVFDAAENKFVINFAKLSFVKEAGPAGFTIDIAAGPMADMVDPEEVSRHIYQAYGSFVLPVGSGLTVDAGKFLTHLGAEVIESMDNSNYSRSFLFGYALPFYHTGIRFSYPVTEDLSLMMMLVNGWDNISDNNKDKTIGGQAAFSLTEDISLTGNFIYGAEGDNDGEKRLVAEAVFNWQMLKMLGINLNYVYGSEKVAGTDLKWNGFAGILSYLPSERFAFAARGELFNDSDGYRFGLGNQSLSEFTLTGDYKPNKNTVLRLEYRIDMSDRDIFVDSDNKPADSQSSILFSMMFKFQ